MLPAALTANRNLRAFALLYGTLSLFMLVFGRGIRFASAADEMVVLSYLLGPISFLAHMSLNVERYWHLALTVYLPPTVLLLVAAWLTQHAGRAVRIAAWCAAAVIWIATGWAGALLVIYGH